MGKIRTRILGLESVEKEQKAKQKKRSQEKKAKVHLSGMKGGERMEQVEVKEEDLEKMKKAKKIIEEKPAVARAMAGKPKKIKARLRGKNYQNAKKLIDKKNKYPLEEAIKLLKKMKYAGFDESVELHLNVDTTALKGEVELPHATGRSVKVTVVDDDVLDDIEKGKINFDILVTHPSYMPKLAKFAKILGPRGLMPNPKAGTISDRPDEVVKKFSKGALRWKTEAKFPLIHQMIGKISFETKALIENATKFINAVGKPHVKKVVIKSTMSPSVKIDLEKI